MIHPIHDFKNLPKAKRTAIIAKSATVVGAAALTAAAYVTGKDKGLQEGNKVLNRILAGYGNMAGIAVYSVKTAAQTAGKGIVTAAKNVWSAITSKFNK